MINEKDVQHIARLARLRLNQKEIKKYQKELASILDYFEELKKVTLPTQAFAKQKRRGGEESLDSSTTQARQSRAQGWRRSEASLTTEETLKGVIKNNNITRQDEVLKDFPNLAEKLLKLAPAVKNNYFKVKSVFKNGVN